MSMSLFDANFEARVLQIKRHCEYISCLIKDTREGKYLGFVFSLDVQFTKRADENFVN